MHTKACSSIVGFLSLLLLLPACSDGTGHVASRSGTGGATLGTGGGGTGGANPGGGGATQAVDAGTTVDGDVCSQLAGTARTQFQSYLDGTSALDCQVDSDCAFLSLPSLNCFAACGLLVGTADVSVVTAAATTACAAYQGAGCPEIRLTCPRSAGYCAGGRCSSGLRPAIDAASDVASDTALTASSDGGGVLDAGAASRCGACGADELCVGYYDGLCTPLAAHCLKVTAATREAILVRHESCFMKPSGDEICGNRDGGVFWGCGDPHCPNEPLVSDINCYGP